MAGSAARIVRAAAQVGLAGLFGYAGVGHLTKFRRMFRAQVPPWFPVDPDTVVVVSGVAEIGLGAALLLLWRQPRRAWAGAAAALFLLAVFPGNISQYVEKRNAFGLDTDTKRAVRLAFQPVLIGWALAATDARRTLWAREDGDEDADT